MDDQLIHSLLGGGLTASGLGGLVLFLARMVKNQWEERLKRIEKQLDECVFAKGELEKTFSDSQIEQQRLFNQDRSAFVNLMSDMVIENTKKKKTGRNRRTGG
tara:strand:- start:352 stop:660 length:309 start_codon:yes stop_codon:yes gene_type:complete